MRLGENPPVLTPSTPAQAIAAPANGIVTTNSLYYQQGLGGYAVSANYHTPYVQNWNLTVSWQANNSTVIELSYVGAKGTHLFLPHENVTGFMALKGSDHERWLKGMRRLVRNARAPAAG